MKHYKGSGEHSIQDLEFMCKERDELIITLTAGLQNRRSVLAYCHRNIQYMFAATITSMILGCDFKDAKSELDKYFKENQNEI